MKQKSYCLVCGKEKDGIPIKEDYVVGMMRWFNRKVMRRGGNNKVVICRECYPKYSKFRGKFVLRQRAYLILGILFIALGAVWVALMKNASALIMGILFTILLYVLSLLNYVPDIEINKEDAEKINRIKERR
jgi:hypothetical protein